MFEGLLEIVQNPWLYAMLVSYYIFNAAVYSLPEPTPTSSVKYQFAYKFLNTLAGNLQEAFAKKFPDIVPKNKN